MATGHKHRHRWEVGCHFFNGFYWVCSLCRWFGGRGKRPRAAVGLPKA